MKSIWIKTFALTGALALHSHALFGLGGHWAPVMGLEVESSRGTVSPAGANNTIDLDLKGASGLQGFGAKVWLDIIPLVDVEAAWNVQFGYYDVDFLLDSTRYSLSFDLGIPGVDGKPFFARTYGDVAVLYPFFKLPMVKLQAGAGLTWGFGTQVLDARFARRALQRAEAAGDYDPNAATSSSDITDILVDAIKDEGMLSGTGLFLQAGAKVKPPVVPLAVYADAKYRFAGYNPNGVGGPDFSIELGAAFAL